MLKQYSSDRSVFLWENLSLCIGPSSSILQRHYGVPALHIGIYHPFELRVAGQVTKCWCALVPPNLPHKVNFSGSIHAKLFVERDSIDSAHLLNRFPNKEHQIKFFKDQSVIDIFRWI